ncbi:hypothetical protein F9C07_9770 [Aspergillus flavus]|uniref:Uncharacterized protein n=1 Tax=Aspergillus flavus (strain ATCC 200026 / FGSC A1120 / IAM 13836 / NRRL 3357 / JCM 12722 / SRRC 167) TaxID=332952 RepID=A0A7U2QR15_ASPFN|nr:hypothetical protein F9C07_9770 [Aspergillus flavus]
MRLRLWFRSPLWSGRSRRSFREKVVQSPHLSYSLQNGMNLRISLPKCFVNCF